MILQPLKMLKMGAGNNLHARYDYATHVVYGDME